MANTTNYKSTAQTTTPYMDLYDAYERKVKAEGSEYKEGLKKQKATAEQQVEQEFGKGAEEQYVNYMQQSKQLPEQLRGMGIGGGAAESSLLKLKSAYGQGLGGLREQKQSDLSGLQSTYLQNVADYEASQRQSLQDAYANYYAQQLAYDEQRKADELNTFLDNYQSTYTTSADINNAINTLKASDDWNKDTKIQYLQAYKSMLAEQALAAAYSKAASGGTGGSTGGSYQAVIDELNGGNQDLKSAFSGASAGAYAKPHTEEETVYGYGGISSGASKAALRR